MGIEARNEIQNQNALHTTMYYVLCTMYYHTTTSTTTVYLQNISTCVSKYLLLNMRRLIFLFGG